MRDRVRLLLVLLVWVSASCATARDAEPLDAAVAFVDVDVIPMDRERVIPDQTVIVRDGRIASIAPVDAEELPEGLARIDGRGRYLMPGLTDMHVHLMGGEDPGMLLLFLANGVTTVRNMWGTEKILQLRRRIEAGELEGPRIYTTGPILDGEPPFWPGSTVVATPEEAELEVAAEKRAGYDGIKIMANLSPEIYQVLLRAARRHGLPVVGHVPTRVGLVEALGGGQRSFEHMLDFMYALVPPDSPVREEVVAAFSDRSRSSVRNTFVLPYEHAEEGRIASLAEMAADAGAWFCPTLVVDRRFASTPEEFAALQNASLMRYVRPANRERWERMAKTFSSDEGDPAAMKRGYRLMLRAVGAMKEAGAGLLVGTDTPNPYVVPGFSMHEALEILVDAGLTPFEAIAAATREAAEFLGAPEVFGTVAIGKRADLILLERNPLENVSHTADLAGVMGGGRWFSAGELREMLNDAAGRYREAETVSNSESGRD